MVSFQWQAVEIDCCLSCSGVWLDAGELETLLTMGGLPHGPLSDTLKRAADGRRTRRLCPRCPRRLREVKLGPSQNLTLDRCRQGHGLWFDAGEVENLVRSFSQGEEGAVAHFLADLFHHGAGSAPGR